MDVYSLFSWAMILEDGTLCTTLIAFETVWKSRFWVSEAVQGDQKFSPDEFVDALHSQAIDFRPLSARNHSKNALEQKHGVIRSIFPRSCLAE